MSWSVSHKVATFTVGRPGWPWTWTLLQELLQHVRPIVANPSVELLVLDIAPSPGWDFSTLQDPEDRLRCAVQGQLLLQEFRSLPIPTLAVLSHGAVGPAWELALACDYRLATASPSAWIGWPEAPPAWGSLHAAQKLARRSALQQLRQHLRFSAREAARVGLIDDVFTSRRATVEREHWLTKLKRSGRKRVDPVPAAVLAVDRIHFRNWMPPNITVPPLGRLPNTIQTLKILGDSLIAAHWQAEAALHGLWVHSDNPLSPRIESYFQLALRRGRVTPLEADQARQRLSPLGVPDAVWIAEDRFNNWPLLQSCLTPRSVLLAPPAILDDVCLMDLRLDRQLGIALDPSTLTAELVPWSTTSLTVVQAGRAFVEHLGYTVRQFSPITHLEELPHDNLSWTDRLPALASG